MQQFINNQIEEIKQTVGDKKVVCALSGGVDSLVSAMLVHKAIGSNLHCVFVDHGLMRLNEPREVCESFKELGLNIKFVDAEERFLKRLSGVVEPENKRKIIGEEFIRVFEEESKKIGDVEFLVQGTIYPDIVESGTEGNKLVKSHHNVGGLPENMEFKGLVEPLKTLYKDEVREVGLALGIPSELIYRQPFPGPGIGVRVLGELTKEKLDTLRQADYIFREEVKNAGLDKEIWQYFAVLTDVRSTGVHDDSRTYGYMVALRAIHTKDAMTAKFAHLPYDVVGKVSARITSEISNINRVVYDVTNKPPATIEWE